MSNITLVFDCTSANLAATEAVVGKGAQFAGYDTEVGTSAGIKWTATQKAAHPNVVLYDQEPNDSDFLADLLDVEAGAGTIARAGNWYKNTLRNYTLSVRPGQRHPGMYASASNITPLVNGLVTQGITSGPGLVIANWNLSEAQSIADVLAATGPFPIIGIQFKNDGPFDTNVMSTAWLENVSRSAQQATLLGILAYIQEGFKANTSDFVSKRVTSTDNGAHWS